MSTETLFHTAGLPKLYVVWAIEFYVAYVQHKIQYKELIMSEYTQNYMHISTYVYVCKSYAIKMYYRKRRTV
jgi:hypothetical protein